MANPNLELLLGMARAMGPLCEQVVFVGGCATGLLVDDAGLMDVRPTEDVDAIVEVASLGAYHRLAEQLMQRGFTQTMEDNTPPFRWFWHRMQLDLVPLDEKVLGFANPWYRVGFEEALSVELTAGLVVRHLSAPHFLATKFEAFRDRGGNDVYLRTCPQISGVGRRPLRAPGGVANPRNATGHCCGIAPCLPSRIASPASTRLFTDKF